MIRPTADRVLIERLDGDGREETLASGIIMPARDLTIRRTNTHRVPDTFRARVLAVGPKAAHELVVGCEVVVQSYDGSGGASPVGLQTDHGLLVELDDILCAIEPCAEPQDISCFTTPKTKNFEPSPDAKSFAYTKQQIESLGYHRKSGF